MEKSCVPASFGKRSDLGSRKTLLLYFFPRDVNNIIFEQPHRLGQVSKEKNGEKDTSSTIGFRLSLETTRLLELIAKEMRLFYISRPHCTLAPIVLYTKQYRLRSIQPTYDPTLLPLLVLTLPRRTRCDVQWYEMFFSRMSQSEPFVFCQSVESFRSIRVGWDREGRDDGRFERVVDWERC